jgi:hypothetical protein
VTNGLFFNQRGSHSDEWPCQTFEKVSAIVHIYYIRPPSICLLYYIKTTSIYSHYTKPCQTFEKVSTYLLHNATIKSTFEKLCCTILCANVSALVHIYYTTAL